MLTGRDSGPFAFFDGTPMRHLRGDAASSDLPATLAVALLVIAAFLFGGGPRGTGDLVVHLAALPCLAIGLWRWRWARAPRWDRTFLLLLGCAIGLVMLQLLPLPPEVFDQIGPRDSVAADLAQAGHSPAWRPMTLDSWATVRGGLALIVFVSVWLLASTLDRNMQDRLILLAIAVGVAIGLLGFAQAVSGPDGLRFYKVHHPIGAIGTFANRNHFASFSAMLLTLSLAVGVQAQREKHPGRTYFAIFSAGILWLATALSFSRAGFALGTASLIAATCILWGGGRNSSRRSWILPSIVMGIAAIGVITYASDGIAQRMKLDPLEDMRWRYLDHGLVLAHDYWPWGSGIGSFPWVYAPKEPLSQLREYFAERAHNDPLQIVIEAGLPGLILAAWFTTMAVVKGTRHFLIWRANSLRDDSLQGVLVVALAIPFLHAWVDYPFRTLAVAVLTGLLLSTGGGARRWGTQLPGHSGDVA